MGRKEGASVKVIVNGKDRLVEYWLTRNEAADASLLTFLKPEFEKWKKRKYLSVVYESGAEDLEQNLCALLRHNADLLAEQGSRNKNSA